MRDLFSGLAILLIVASLGLLEVPDRDSMVSAGIQAQADAIAAAQRHPVTVEVSGLEIAVAGRVQDRATRADLMRALRGIEGVQKVTHSIEVLPEVQPFALTLGKTTDGVTLAGHVPTLALSRKLAKTLDASDAALVLATGAPDEAWAEVAETLGQALSLLEQGDATLTDREAHLSGQGLQPAVVAKARALLSALPPGYTATTELTALDDGQPYSLLVSRDRRMGLRLSGKLPPDLDPGVLTAAFPKVHDTAFQPAPVDLGAPEFNQVALDGIALLAQMPEGHFSLSGGVATLSGGPVSQSLMAEAQALAGAMPPGHRLQLSLVPADDGAPLGLTLSIEPGGRSLSGKVPQGFDIGPLQAALGAGAVTVTQSPYPDLAGWGDIALATAKLAQHIETGVVTLKADTLVVTGKTASPEQLQALNAAILALPAALQRDVHLELTDASKPPVFSLTYDAVEGAALQGILPAGLDASTIKGALGLQEIAGTPRQSGLGAPDDTLQILRAIASWLPEAEALKLDFDTGSLSLAATLSPGADAELIRKDTRAASDALKQARMGMMSDFPPAETIRLNAASQSEQIFLAGFWLPRLDFEPTLTACRTFTTQALEEGAVNFLSGSRRLDARAVRVINRMSAVARRCVTDGGLTLRIGGHTDNVGKDAGNLRLSRARAQTVAEAIALRGVAAEGMTADGFGAARPVADNATPEGRAANRRITFDWPTPDALPE